MCLNKNAEFIEIVKNLILPNGYGFDYEVAELAYKRLFNSLDAIKAWHDLYELNETVSCDCENHSEEDIVSRLWWQNLPKIEKWTFFAHDFSNIFKNCFIRDSDRVTRDEIKKSADEVSVKARELAYLINKNFALLNIKLGECLLDSEKQAFQTAAEVIRDNYNKQNYPDFNATHYLNIAHHNNMLSQNLRDILLVFATKAKETETVKPIKPQPKSEDLEPRLFCEALCGFFKFTYGQPLAHIASAFASAMFDKNYSNDTVKSWWNRLDKT